jgi:Uma2 family endonuclease
MATAPTKSVYRNGYPTSDGKPMAETDHHRDLMVDLIQTLKAFYAAQQRVYVSGNLLVFYEPGNRRRHVSPDVFVVKGVPKHDRLNYLVWEEKKGPDVVIELTSSSTRREDLHGKFRLYRETLRVKEYFLFDPFGDYLGPTMQGYRLRAGEYRAIQPVRARLPSRVLGLHLERSGSNLRLFDPATGRWLPTDEERGVYAQRDAQERVLQAQRDAQERVLQAQEQVIQAQERAMQAEAGFARVEAEVERLRREVEELRRRQDAGNSGRS